MTEPAVAKPLKTWSHLASRRRKSSEYEIVSTNMHYTTDRPDAPFELDPNFPAALWFKTNRNNSPLKHGDWNAFRDPDETVYRTYNMIQDGQENYVHGLLDQFSDRGHDAMLDQGWVQSLARFYTPGRYLFHALQMAAAYLCQIAPASTISNAATFQASDSLRWLSHTSYRTKELANSFPNLGFGLAERGIWEGDPAWEGFRELAERGLVAYDWAENFVAINLVLRPAVEESLLRGLGQAARHNGDMLLGLLSDAQLLDADRHRRWASALVKMALEVEGNKAVLDGFLAKWVPLGDAAIDAYCSQLPDARDTSAIAREACAAFRQSLGLAVGQS